MVSTGILGVGLYLPSDVRKNSWWPDAIVQGWEAKRRESLLRATVDQDDAQTEGARLTREAMFQHRNDVFAGGLERRVMGKGESPSDMEFTAAEDAIARAGVSKNDIDLMLVYSQLPDFLVSPQATLLHERLGLKPECLVFDTQGVCNSFFQQLEVARQFIANGAIKNALLIQSSAFAHICRPEDHHSVLFGDGATAEVVGAVSDGRGVLSTAHLANGKFYRAVVAGCPNKQWWDASEIYLYNEDRVRARNMLLLIADMAKEVLDISISRACVKPENVDFYATHQSTLWFREVTQKYVGLAHAKSFDSYAWTASLGASNVPFMLGMGEREGLLRDGDLVAMYGGGGGITYSSAMLRWGR